MLVFTAYILMLKRYVLSFQYISSYSKLTNLIFLVEKNSKKYCRILSCFKLNAFEYLNLPFDSTVEEVKKQYRKVSLLQMGLGQPFFEHYLLNLWAIHSHVLYWIICSYHYWFTLTNASTHKQRRHLEVSRFIFKFFASNE